MRNILVLKSTHKINLDRYVSEPKEFLLEDFETSLKVDDLPGSLGIEYRPCCAMDWGFPLSQPLCLKSSLVRHQSEFLTKGPD